MYLAMGMTYDEYWHGNCDRTIYYRKAFRLKQRMRNQELWLQGRYIYVAVGNLSPILRTSFSNTRVEPEPYPEEPFPIDMKEAEERRIAQENKEMEMARERVAAWVSRFKKGDDQ